MDIFEGIQTAGRRAAWWHEDFELLPSDGEQQQVSDRDVWATANRLIRMCPNDHELEAARRSDAALAESDVFNARLWARVLTAVQKLRRQKPAGEAMN